MISTKTKSLAIPAKDTIPSFEDVFAIALTGAQFNLSVGVICFTQKMLDCWMCRLEEITEDFSISVPDLLDADAATLEDWEEYLAGQTYNITVFSGARDELQQHHISVEYVKALVDAAPAGTIVLA